MYFDESSAVISTAFTAGEFSLTIALVVFVMLTVLLTAVLVLLCVSKNFRVFLFRENKTVRKKRKNKKTSKTNVADGGGSNVKKERSDSKNTGKRAVPEYLDAVPTVPLGFPSAQSQTYVTRGKKRQNTPDPVLSADATDGSEQHGGTYTANMQTVTKTRNTARRSDSGIKSDNADDAEVPQNTRSGKTKKSGGKATKRSANPD